MSKNINVNPGQYKVAGREHQGEGILQGRALSQKQAEEEHIAAGKAPRPPRRRRKPAGEKTRG